MSQQTGTEMKLNGQAQVRITIYWTQSLFLGPICWKNSQTFVKKCYSNYPGF